jgi:hypothetical protein
MRFECRRGQNEKKWKKNILQFVKAYFLYKVYLAGPFALHFKDNF